MSNIPPKSSYRKKTALEHRKLNLFAPTPGYPDKLATLIWGVFANNPRLTVYTGDPSDNSEKNAYGRISANLDTPTFFAFIELLQRIAKSTVAVTRKIKNKNFVWENGKRAEFATNVSDLIVAKDSDGTIWISVFAEDRPEVKFYMGPSDYHHLCNADNTPISKGEASELYALGYCNLLSNMVSNVLVDEYIEDIPSKPNNYPSRQTVNPSMTNSSLATPMKAPDNLITDDIPF
jgi:hypothetical protein